jgi:pentatricopeptide repeat protein
VSALNVYEWMKAPRSAGGAALTPTVYTYTAAMRAALSANMLDKAMQIWSDCEGARCRPDCRLSITYIEVSSDGCCPLLACTSRTTCWLRAPLHRCAPALLCRCGPCAVSAAAMFLEMQPREERCNMLCKVSLDLGPAVPLSPVPCVASTGLAF